MAMQLAGASGDARSEPPTWTALVLEMVALRHQIAVLKRSGTRRPRFRFSDRLFWLLLARWWPGWRDSLMIVQPATVLRWGRSGWLGLWRYRSRGRWRGERPRISREIRQLIVRMARENFLWGAPRIHGELLMLEFTVSQATVSRYVPPTNQRAGTIVAHFYPQSSPRLAVTTIRRMNRPGTTRVSGTDFIGAYWCAS